MIGAGAQEKLLTDRNYGHWYPIRNVVKAGCPMTVRPARRPTSQDNGTWSVMLALQRVVQEASTQALGAETGGTILLS